MYLKNYLEQLNQMTIMNIQLKFNLMKIIQNIENNKYNNNLSGIENETTGATSMEQKGEQFIKNKINLNKKKFFFDKDSVMDKENNEILKEEQSLNDSVLDSDKKIINIINCDKFKKSLRDFMNKN